MTKKIVFLLGIVLIVNSCRLGRDAGEAISDSLDRLSSQGAFEIRNSVDVLDRGIDALVRQSADWQQVLQELQDKATLDFQSTLRVEITNLLRMGILATGGEFRCNTEFINLKTQRRLINFRNQIAQDANDAGINPPLPILPVPDTIPMVCSALPSNVNITLNTERRSKLEFYGFDFLSKIIHAEIINQNGTSSLITNHLSTLSDFHLLIDLSSENGATLTSNARKIRLTWSNDSSAERRNFLSEVPIILNEPEENCSIKEVLVAGTSHTIIPRQAQGNGVGDLEFYGNGPCVKITYNIYFPNAGGAAAPPTSVFLDYEVEFRECNVSDGSEEGDNSVGMRSGTIELFKVGNPNTERIVGIKNLSTDEFEFEYRDVDHEEDMYFVAGTSPIEKLIFIGDSRGDDIGVRSQVNIFLRELRVDVRVCQNQ